MRIIGKPTLFRVLEIQRAGRKLRITSPPPGGRKVVAIETLLSGELDPQVVAETFRNAGKAALRRRRMRSATNCTIGLFIVVAAIAAFRRRKTRDN